MFDKKAVSIFVLAVGATSAFAQTSTATGTITTTVPLTNGALLIGAGSSCYQQTGGAAGSFTMTATYSLESFVGIPFTSKYTFLARDGASGVSIALAPAVAADAIATGKTWSQVLGNLTQAQAYTTLTNLYSSVNDGSLFGFFAANKSLFPDFNTTGTMVRFSPAASGGTITNVTPVPEPATFAALGLGAVALLRRRRA